MIKSRDISESLFSDFELLESVYSYRKLNLLKKSWAGVFRKHILPLLPAEKIRRKYSSRLGRPSKELYTVIGAVVLQQFFDLTDPETVKELAFNEQWHFALDCFDENDQIISEKTLWTMRDNIVKLGLSSSIFNLTTDHLIKYFNVDVSKQRIDSVHVHSNMAHLGRIRILVRTIMKFLKNLKRHHSELFKEEVSSEVQTRYLKKSEKSYFGQIKPSKSEHNLQVLADDMYSLISTFSSDASVSHMMTFKLLLRVFSEHCDVDNEQVVVKPSIEVPSDSVQNPSDPDAGYDGHKGKGYQTQIMETYSTEEDRKSDEDKNSENKKNPSLNLLTYIKTESADKHDSHALEPALKEIQERGQECKEVLADTLYGSNKNEQDADELGIDLVSPTPGKASKKGFEEFEINPDNLEILSCKSGKKPDKIKHNKKGSITAFWNNSTCNNCPFEASCPTKKSGKGRRFSYMKNAVKFFFRRQFEESLEFKDKYRYRSGIEATNSRFIHMTGARRLRYRGLEKMRFGQKLRALAINVFRIRKYLQKLRKFTKLSTFFANNFISTFKYGFKLKIAA